MRITITTDDGEVLETRYANAQEVIETIDRFKRIQDDQMDDREKDMTAAELLRDVVLERYTYESREEWEEANEEQDDELDT